MPAAGGEFGDDLDAAAAGYADALDSARRPDDPDDVPNFDVVLLGVGPDGHCCSLFPEHPGVYEESGPVIAVRNSPKPPPLRLSLSFAGLNAANEIWVVAAGTGKADAAALALGGRGTGAGTCRPGARGRHRTLWLLDRDAAAKLPHNLYKPPLPSGSPTGETPTPQPGISRCGRPAPSGAETVLAACDRATSGGCAANSGWLIGSRRQITVPPGIELRALTSPPCASTTAFTMASPIPVPPRAVPLRKLSKM